MAGERSRLQPATGKKKSDPARGSGTEGLKTTLDVATSLHLPLLHVRKMPSRSKNGLYVNFLSLAFGV